VIDNVVASRRILTHLREGRLVQGTWHDALNDGRELACLLGAIAPHIDDISKCPASVMPAWLAILTVPMFDGQATDVALAWAGRFGAQMAQWHRLDSVAWDRVRAAFCAACVADARRSAAAAYTAVYAAYASAYAADRAVDAAAAAAYAAARAVDAAAADAAADAVNAAYFARDDRSACWVRLATALCDAIDAELAALAAKETT
jgi:hypothetical protein